MTSVVSASIEDSKLKVTRKLETLLQDIELSLPAVLSLLPEAAPAPIPGLKAVLDAKKKPTDHQTIETSQALSALAEATSECGYSSERKCVILEEDTLEATATALVASLKKEGVLR